MNFQFLSFFFDQGFYINQIDNIHGGSKLATIRSKQATIVLYAMIENNVPFLQALLARDDVKMHHHCWSDQMDEISSFAFSICQANIIDARTKELVEKKILLIESLVFPVSPLYFILGKNQPFFKNQP